MAHRAESIALQARSQIFRQAADFRRWARIWIMAARTQEFSF